MDPRLDAILDMGRASFERLRRAEVDELRALAGEIRDAERAGLPRQSAELLHRKLFLPFTAGVRLPGEQRGLPAELQVSGEPVLSVLLRAEISADDLFRHGFHCRSRSGDVFTAWIAWSRLEALGQVPGLRAVELARALRPSLDVARSTSGLDVLHGTHKGSGVLVGVVDRFLDFRQGDFGTGAATRVAFLWDQELEASGAEQTPADRSSSITTSLLDYGVEYRKSDVQDDYAAASPYDVVRHRLPGSSGSELHGTHAAGVAVGDGAQSGGTYAGAAPKAELVFVHLRSELEESLSRRPADRFPMLGLVESGHLLDACAFVFARAEEEGKACVLSLSRNDALGSHDGHSLVEEFLAAAIDGPGRAAAVSAGNLRQRSLHSSGTATAQLDLEVPAGATLPEEVQIWSASADLLSASLSFRAPGGGELDRLAATPAGTEVSWPATGTPAIRGLATAAPDAEGGNSISFFFLPNDAGVVPEGRFRVTLTRAGSSGGDFHAWTSASNEGTYFSSLVDADALTVAPPATAERVLAVGAHVGAAGRYTAAAYSGRGPTRGPVPRTRPDLLAPTDVQAPGKSIFPTPYAGFSGTSASAPLVAGAAALVFECKGKSWTWDLVADLLHLHALAASGMPAGLALPDDTWGWGRLNAAALCAAVPATPVDSRELTEIPEPELLPEDFGLLPLPPVPDDTRELLFTLTWEGPGGLELLPQLAAGEVELELPLAALPLRTEVLLARLAVSRPRLGRRRRRDPFAHLRLDLGARETALVLDARGASRARIERGVVRLFVSAGGRLRIPWLRLEARATLRAVLRARGARGGPIALNQFQEGRWRRALRLRLEEREGAGGR